MNFKEDLRKHFGINLSAEQENKFEKYYKLLVEYNKHTNLTRIIEHQEVYYKHFYDSLTIMPFIKDFNKSLCDMGSGAGFPSIPIKIIKENLNITIVDSSLKRINFLKELIKELDLKGIKLVHSRIEDFASSNLKKFDYVTARALGNARLISELGIPLLKIKGQFLMMKGSQGYEEIREAKNTLEVLESTVINKHLLELPYNYGERTIFVIEKNKHVNGYPRKYQEILKKPL